VELYRKYGLGSSGQSKVYGIVVVFVVRTITFNSAINIRHTTNKRAGVMSIGVID
jgi:hypothetical protein